MSLTVPAHASRSVPWRQTVRGGTRADRTLTEVVVSIPPSVSTVAVAPDPDLVAEMESALRAAVRADQRASRHFSALSGFLIRTESVASSKIERIDADSADFARALAGIKANTSATSMVAATRALRGFVEAVGASQRISVSDLLGAHSTLMRGDPQEQAWAGRVRDMQNWIGGSDYSPRDALFVPPPPSLVDDLLADLIAYANRDDVPVLVQAAVAHAQFESIHPFTDGNGRIGRTLIGAILRRRAVAEVGVVPIASGLLAVRDDYFDALGAYRSGDAGRIIRLLTLATTVAAEAMSESLEHLSRLPEEWREELTPRRGSVTATLLDALFDHPVISATDAELLAGGASMRAVYDSMDALEGAGVIREITGRKRDRVWAASAVMAELDSLNSEIGMRMRARSRRA